MKKLILGIGFAFGLGLTAIAAENSTRTLNEYTFGSFTSKQGLESWQLFYEVASHPRCANCHVGEDNRPMWSGPSYGTARPHGMNINAGESRIGVETIPCATCHATLKEDDPAVNALPHSPPKVAQAWGLAPVEAEWFGKTSSEICNQLKDPERNGDRTIRELAEHLDHDKVLQWAWNPGGNREPAPHSLDLATDALLKWAAAGAPCPDPE